MPRRLNAVKLDFVESAPLRLVFTADVAATPSEVYRALAEDVEGWPGWFRSVAWAKPTREGAGRDVALRGGVRFQETIMASDPAVRYAYRIDETNLPGVRAMLEEWRLTPSGSGTRVRWTMAVDGPGPLRVGIRLAKPGVGHSFRDAVRRLERRLASEQAG
ncbi:SRPBCC family protein [Streptomyces sp. SCSIO 30461]|uniref:SRPBCC family protein n=1 Tax=Streptomyces sp. SCSIO 30461 TaxID=3118085 RepID=UPI0030D322D0